MIETTVTVLFTDVVGSTNMRQHQGETTAHEIVNLHNDLVRQKNGSSSTRKAVECAIGIERSLNDYNSAGIRLTP